MPQFHTTERLGAVQSVTHDGFLICQGVPVARTGELLYAPGELPIPPSPDGLIRVFRTEDAVFDPASMASFEGKTLVDTHPMSGEDVTPANWRQHAIGHTQNVCRGTGEQAHVLLADIVVKDAAAIAAVRAGVHPRACGEHFSRPQRKRSHSGSSPRLRRTLIPVIERLQCSRFIPAPAGNTGSRRRWRARASVHPRACGEHLGCFGMLIVFAGSSPRLRGTHRSMAKRNQFTRFIPAPAGNTATKERPDQ